MYVNRALLELGGVVLCVGCVATGHMGSSDEQLWAGFLLKKGEKIHP